MKIGGNEKLQGGGAKRLDEKCFVLTSTRETGSCQA